MNEREFRAQMERRCREIRTACNQIDGQSDPLKVSGLLVDIREALGDACESVHYYLGYIDGSGDTVGGSSP